MQTNCHISTGSKHRSMNSTLAKAIMLCALGLPFFAGTAQAEVCPTPTMENVKWDFKQVTIAHDIFTGNDSVTCNFDLSAGFFSLPLSLTSPNREIHTVTMNKFDTEDWDSPSGCSDLKSCEFTAKDINGKVIPAFDEAYRKDVTCTKDPLYQFDSRYITACNFISKIMRGPDKDIDKITQ